MHLHSVSGEVFKQLCNEVIVKLFIIFMHPFQAILEPHLA